MSLSLDQEQTIIKFNGKDYDLTDIRDVLVKRSSLLRTLLEDCSGDISIDTDLIDDDLFKTTIDYIAGNSEIPTDEIERVNIALNYLGVDSGLIEDYHTKLYRDIRGQKLSKDDVLSLIKMNKDNRLTRMEEILYGNYEIDEYCQLFEDLTENFTFDQFMEMYGFWSKRVHPSEIMIDMGNYTNTIDTNIIDFIPRYGRDRSLLDIHKYIRYLKYTPPDESHTSVDSKFKVGDEVILSKELNCQVP